MEKVQKGVVCICAECKKVIKVIGDAASPAAQTVSHGICPECADRLYGDIFRARS